MLKLKLIGPSYAKILLVFPNYATFLNCPLHKAWQISPESLHVPFVGYKERSLAIVAVLARHFSERAVSFYTNQPT